MIFLFVSFLYIYFFNAFAISVNFAYYLFPLASFSSSSSCLSVFIFSFSSSSSSSSSSFPDLHLSHISTSCILLLPFIIFFVSHAFVLFSLLLSPLITHSYLPLHPSTSPAPFPFTLPLPPSPSSHPTTKILSLWWFFSGSPSPWSVSGQGGSGSWHNDTLSASQWRGREGSWRWPCHRGGHHSWPQR